MEISKLNAAGLLLFNSGYIYRRLRKESEKLGIRWTQVTLLKDIELLAPVTQKELAKVNHMSGPSISVIVNEMVDLGLVVRKVNPLDKRSSSLSLTPKGQRRLENDGNKLQRCLVPLLEELSSSDIEQILEAELALAKVIAK